MIAKIYKLPAWLTSPDDKPDKQLWDVLISSSTYSSSIEAETISAPDLDTITVQTGGLGDLQTQQLYLSNFINVGTFWYQITNIYYTQQTNNGVYMVEGKLDIYFSFLVSFFDETTTNSNRVYVHQKHLNRQIINKTPTTMSSYLYPQIQHYLLNKHPALKDIGKQLVKSYHILQPNLYPQTPLVIQAGWTQWTTTVDSSVDGTPRTNDFTVGVYTPAITKSSYTANNYFKDTTGSCAYPVLIVKADTNSNMVSSHTNGLFPYFLYDWGQTYGLSSANDLAQVRVTPPSYFGLQPYQLDTFYYPSDTSSTYTKLFDIASDYYIGLYLFPLPIISLQTNWGTTTKQAVPLSDILNQGLFNNGKAYKPSFPGTNDAPYGTQAWVNAIGSDIANLIEDGALCNLLGVYINGNTFYGVPNSNFTPINNKYINNNGAEIEPALLNWMGFNVRLYGQDNLVRPLDFNYNLNNLEVLGESVEINKITTMDSLYCYLNYFAITISPPNVMITNIPYHDLTYNVFTNYGVPTWIPQFWAVNGYNDAVFSAMMKSEVPTPSTAWTNYIANSKNSYDMGLNISNLLAQNAQAEVQIAKNNMGIAIANEIGGLGGVIGDIFTGKWGAMGSAIGGLASGGVSIANASIDANTIAPNNADIQQMRYNYMATGKQQDMSRTSNMRVSATATTNTLNDTVYTVIDEVPPMYEQVYVINYYALNGYIVNKWDLWKYWFNRTICNFISCSFFTNAMLPNLNINWKTKIDTLLNKGFRVWCYNNNQQVQLNPTTTAPINWNTVPYNLVLYQEFNDGTCLYNNTENNDMNGTAEIYYLYKGEEANNQTIQAWINKEIVPKHEKTKTDIQDTKKDKPK